MNDIESMQEFEIRNLKVSAVIPIYNGETFLKEAFESIISQTVPPQEVVIIDDGSDDRTLEIAEDLAKNSKLLVKVYSQNNSGVSAARNTGIVKSSGDLIAFLDADDLWEATKLEKTLALYSEKQDPYLLCFTDYYEDMREDHTRKSLNSENVKVSLTERFSAKDFQLAFIKENFVGTASSIVFNRELALKICGFNISLNYSEDFDFIIRYSKFASVRFLPEPLVLKRNHGANLSKNRKLYLWSHKAALHANILHSHNYCRYAYDDQVVKAMKVSADEFLRLLSNEYYNESRWIGLRSFAMGFKELQTSKGFIKFLFAAAGKLVRTLTFNLIRRY